MFHVWWPATAVLALLVFTVVMLILRYSHKWCGARNEAQTTTAEYTSAEDMEMVAYEHSVNTEKEFSV